MSHGDDNHNVFSAQKNAASLTSTGKTGGFQKEIVLTWEPGRMKLVIDGREPGSEFHDDLHCYPPFETLIDVVLSICEQYEEAYTATADTRHSGQTEMQATDAGFRQRFAELKDNLGEIRSACGASTTTPDLKKLTDTQRTTLTDAMQLMTDALTKLSEWKQRTKKTLMGSKPTNTAIACQTVYDVFDKALNIDVILAATGTPDIAAAQAAVVLATDKTNCAKLSSQLLRHFTDAADASAAASGTAGAPDAIEVGTTGGTGATAAHPHAELTLGDKLMASTLAPTANEPGARGGTHCG